MKRLVISLLLCVTGAAWSADSLFTANDHRFPIEVTSRERNQILYEMREFLHGLHNIHQALARDDLKAVALETQPMGDAFNRIPGNVRERMPEGFQQMSIAMQEAFVSLNRAASVQRDGHAVDDRLAEIMTYCSGCHDTYRFEVVAYKANKRPAVEKVNPYIPK
ncbi:hypothetical protein EZJ19_09420 [Parasulfuritortus cantonensis]|uniref:Cytochrome c n=1 Tax=Parasulfuritortus cantonensis TaxID=2528202 RepID=A0A4R1BCE4_9PROT|nr:cytochrome c [Parasulfuritortus cantonensis]TCJ14657.1 hypothetical protein EZJ19_09420 [Parasulfuritortus cantonensis]